MKQILLMTDGIYRAVVGTSLVPINSTTRGTAHIDNINSIPSLQVKTSYILKANKFEVIPYPLPKWADNIEIILAKYYEVLNEDQKPSLSN